jgi:hypothetical protein
MSKESERKNFSKDLFLQKIASTEEKHWKKKTTKKNVFLKKEPLEEVFLEI